MKSPKVVATSIGLVLVTATSAVALNVGIVRATSPADDGYDETVALAADGSPLVVTLETAALPIEDTTTSEAQATPSVPAAAPASSAAARSVATDTVAPTPVPAPTPAPAVAAPATTYHTFQAGNAGEVVIANHGDSLEFWAAYTSGGWEYRVDRAEGREVKIKFRGNGELEWKAILSGGSIRIESSGGGGGDDEKDDDEKDHDEKDHDEKEDDDD